MVWVLVLISWCCVCVFVLWDDNIDIGDKFVLMDECFFGVVIGCWNGEGVCGVRRFLEIFDFVVGV